jgi:rhomboid protease GluP
MCPHCRAFITTDDRVCPYCNTPVGPRAIDRRQPGQIMGGLIPHARFTTTLLLLINVGIYIATALHSMNAGHGGFMDIDIQTLYQFGAKYRPAIFAGQWWRLVTANYLHGGLLHIGMNGWVLYDVGAQSEEVFGAARMIVCYFVAGVAGFYTSLYWTPAISVGASAAIMGLIGAMIAFGVRSRSAYARALRGHYIQWAIYIVAIGLLIPEIDNAAHIGGVIAGFGIGYVAGEPKIGGTVERIWQVLAGVCILLTVFCFAELFLWLASAGVMRG